MIYIYMIYIYICTYMCMYVYMYIYKHIYIYIYIPMSFQSNWSVQAGLLCKPVETRSALSSRQSEADYSSGWSRW